MINEEYEISVWDDVIDTITLEDTTTVTYYKEKKLFTIGSNIMTASCRAVEPQLIENVDGTNKFTFKMYYNCARDTFENLVQEIATTSTIDELYALLRATDFSQATYKNPFIGFLINERKVKVKWKGKWYDLLIKNCDENSDQKSITYTCTDTFINELSKTGFELELDNELANNQGTVTELGTTILNGTDWAVDSNGSDLIQQTREEAVYEMSINNTFQAINQTDNNTSITIPSDATILIYYNQVQEIRNLIESGSSWGFFDMQFAYAQEYERAKGGQLVTNAACCIVEGARWNKVVDTIVFRSGSLVIGYLDFSSNNPSLLSRQYRAERLVRTQRSAFDPLTKKYCNIYTATSSIPSGLTELMSAGNEIYGYKEIQYEDPITVNNLVVNSKDFVSTEGWVGDGLTFKLYPQYSAQQVTTPKSYLKINKTPSSGTPTYNAGLRQLSNYIPEGLVHGKQYVFRYKARIDDGGNPSETTYVNFNQLLPSVQTYTYDDEGHIIIPENSHSYCSIANHSHYVDPDSHWVEFTFTCMGSASRADIYNNRIGIFLNCGLNNGCWLEEAQFYPLVYGTPEHEGDPAPRINPGDLNILSVAVTHYKYYNHTRSLSLHDKDDIVYIWDSTEDYTSDSAMSAAIEPLYSEDYAKVCNINAKQTSRYNMLQTLAETFGCWVQFDIQHEANGAVKYINGVPQKFVRFKKENGQLTGIGFVYGIDLKTIQRTIQSDQIVTKTIVQPNKNEFATNGFCTIARSKENFSRMNFILNFEYYVSQGLIDADTLDEDLFMYERRCQRTSIVYNSAVEEELTRRNTLLKQQSYVTLYTAAVESTQEQINLLQSELISSAGTDSWEGAQPWIQANLNNDEVSSRVTTICALENSLQEYNTALTNLESGMVATQQAINAAIATQSSWLLLLQDVHKQFYKKYSRFIQEGTWIDESYTDDDLYYLDALKKARESSRPQVSYNISVMRVSCLDEFKSKVFHLGDITYIEDPDFFGYVIVNGIRTPYREIVRISEITSNFDEPEKDTFKVQNYKTEFEDLFQRINNSSQVFRYSAGGYNRINSLIESNGLIKESVLQDSLQASRVSYNTTNENIKQDATGLVLSDATDASKKTKITSGGVFVSQDGGATWKNVVNEKGLATSQLTKGIINTRNINLMDEDHTSFRWDQNGISAYDTTTSSGIDPSRYVRFDHLGLYGMNNNNAIPSNVTDVWNEANFGLTWDGLFIKNGSIYTGKIYSSGNKDGLSVYGAEDGISFYTMEAIDPRIQSFESNQTYYEYSSGQYIVTADSTPKIYYYPSHDTYAQLEHNVFVSGVTYYEKIDEEYIPTSDIEPKIYYIARRSFYMDGSGLGIDGDTLGESQSSYVIDKDNSGNVYGRFNRMDLGVRSSDDTSLLSLDGESIQQHLCGPSTCALGGNIQFGSTPSSRFIDLRASSRSTSYVTVTSNEFVVHGVNASNAASFILDANEGTLTYSWTDSSDIPHKSILNFTTHSWV